MADKLSISIEGAKAVRDALYNLPDNLVGKGGTAVRASVRKAAKLVRDRAAANLTEVIARANIGPEESTGLLVDSLVVSRYKSNLTEGEQQVVRIQSKKYPDDETGETTTTQVGRLLEYGSEKREPMPWMFPAFMETKEEAVNVMLTELEKRLAKIWSKV